MPLASQTHRYKCEYPRRCVTCDVQICTYLHFYIAYLQSAEIVSIQINCDIDTLPQLIPKLRIYRC